MEAGSKHSADLLPSSCCPLAGQLLGHFMSGAAQKGLKSVASKPVKLFGGFFCPSDYVCFQSFSEGFPGDLHGSNELEQGSAMYRGDLLGKEPASGPVLHAASQFWYLTLLESRRVSRWWPLINPAFPTQQSARCCYVQGAVHLQVGSPAELCSCPNTFKTFPWALQGSASADSQRGVSCALSEVGSGK